MWTSANSKLLWVASLFRKSMLVLTPATCKYHIITSHTEREGGREGEREGGRKGRREGGRDGGREGGREGGRDQYLILCK